ncbi:hypothetical protein HYW74_02915 [Candidatus Pacearchaeota archaeon]|nr:hypothetical protein [Candidatus Pacearchaeota archaeon]
MRLLKYLRARLPLKKDLDLTQYLDPFMDSLNENAGYFLQLEGLNHKGFNDFGLDLMFQDTTFALALRGSNVPIIVEGSPNYGGRVALIGFNNIGDDLRIEQLQANSRAKEFIPRRFDRMLVNVLKKFSSDRDFKRLRMQVAKDHKGYYHVPHGRTLEEYQKSMELRYDVTAKRNGFRFDESLGDYVFDL